ncbi:hypothetical protein KFL_011680010 [Klebsormidium nitens]|uniref:Ubiquitin-like protease family profile domain-containing protein n=1 Tax=Klebsormidium nitens TaxID=105231 RepID=A0A1Y1IS45_KLENI|nr:hypothetical protein KFL_011680010 [Klebsormidium nitens]|eukprot:GAQ92852.1 hypothetical protein KFL_011680010 [Klebsormidium nitens]
MWTGSSFGVNMKGQRWLNGWKGTSRTNLWYLRQSSFQEIQALLSLRRAHQIHAAHEQALQLQKREGPSKAEVWQRKGNRRVAPNERISCSSPAFEDFAKSFAATHMKVGEKMHVQRPVKQEPERDEEPDVERTDDGPGLLLCVHGGKFRLLVFLRIVRSRKDHNFCPHCLDFETTLTAVERELRSVGAKSKQVGTAPPHWMTQRLRTLQSEQKRLEQQYGKHEMWWRSRRLFARTLEEVAKDQLRALGQTSTSHPFASSASSMVCQEDKKGLLNLPIFQRDPTSAPLEKTVIEPHGIIDCRSLEAWEILINKGQNVGGEAFVAINVLLAWALSNLNGEKVFVNLLDNASDLHNRFRFCLQQFLVDLGVVERAAVVYLPAHHAKHFMDAVHGYLEIASRTTDIFSRDNLAALCSSLPRVHGTCANPELFENLNDFFRNHYNSASMPNIKAHALVVASKELNGVVLLKENPEDNAWKSWQMRPMNASSGLKRHASRAPGPHLFRSALPGVHSPPSSANRMEAWEVAAFHRCPRERVETVPAENAETLLLQPQESLRFSSARFHGLLELRNDASASKSLKSVFESVLEIPKFKVAVVASGQEAFSPEAFIKESRSPFAVFACQILDVNQSLLEGHTVIPLQKRAAKEAPALSPTRQQTKELAHMKVVGLFSPDVDELREWAAAWGCREEDVLDWFLGRRGKAVDEEGPPPKKARMPKKSALAAAAPAGKGAEEATKRTKRKRGKERNGAERRTERNGTERNGAVIGPQASGLGHIAEMDVQQKGAPGSERENGAGLGGEAEERLRKGTEPRGEWEGGDSAVKIEQIRETREEPKDKTEGLAPQSGLRAGQGKVPKPLCANTSPQASKTERKRPAADAKTAAATKRMRAQAAAYKASMQADSSILDPTWFSDQQRLSGDQLSNVFSTLYINPPADLAPIPTFTNEHLAMKLIEISNGSRAWPSKIVQKVKEMNGCAVFVVGDCSHWRSVFLDGRSKTVFLFDPYFEKAFGGGGLEEALNRAFSQSEGWGHDRIKLRLQSNDFQCGVSAAFFQEQVLQFVWRGEAEGYVQRFTEFFLREVQAEGLRPLPYGKAPSKNQSLPNKEFIQKKRTALRSLLENRKEFLPLQPGGAQPRPQPVAERPESSAPAAPPTASQPFPRTSLKSSEQKGKLPKSAYQEPAHPRDSALPTTECKQQGTLPELGGAQSGFDEGSPPAPGPSHATPATAKGSCKGSKEDNKTAERMLLADIATDLPIGQAERAALLDASTATTKPNTAVCSVAWRHAPAEIKQKCTDLALVDRERAQKDRASALALISGAQDIEPET